MKYIDNQKYGKKVICENSNSDNPPVDICRLKKNINGDEELLSELVRMLINEYPLHLNGIKEAFKKRDYIQLKKSAHTFKGALSNFGASQAIELSYQLEKMGREGNLKNGMKVLNLLEKEMESIEIYLTRVLALT